MRNRSVERTLQRRGAEAKSLRSTPNRKTFLAVRDMMRSVRRDDVVGPARYTGSFITAMYGRFRWCSA